MGFLAMWNPGRNPRWSERVRYFLGGLAGGAALLFDYSGVVLLAGLFCYCVAKAWDKGISSAWRGAVSYALGAAGPILLLCFTNDPVR